MVHFSLKFIIIPTYKKYTVAPIVRGLKDSLTGSPARYLVSRNRYDDFKMWPQQNIFAKIITVILIDM